MLPSDLAASVSKFINSPPGQLTAGAALAGLVWKFFERVEAVLTEQTKFEIAVWLVGIDMKNKVPWPETFVTMFTRFFGNRHMSLKCFARSCLISFCLFSSMEFFLFGFPEEIGGWYGWTAYALLYVEMWFIFSAVPTFVGLWGTRLYLSALPRLRREWLKVLILGIDLYVTIAFSFAFGSCGILPIGFASASAGTPDSFREALENIVSFQQWLVTLLSLPAEFVSGLTLSYVEGLKEPGSGTRYVALLYVLPAFSGSIWLWLYVSSGFLLRSARRLDLLENWFNRKFDIERKPLQAIGLVAGSLSSICYWSITAALHVLGVSIR
jgi:hypothetical protein